MDIFKELGSTPQQRQVLNFSVGYDAVEVDDETLTRLDLSPIDGLL